MKSLKHKIFLWIVALLLIVQALAFWTLYHGNRNQQQAEIDNQLNTARIIVSELFERRIDYLAAFAETAAKDYGLKQVFNEDKRSLLVALNNHRKRINADLAMAVSIQGNITGQLLRVFPASSKAPAGKEGKVVQGPESGQEFRHPEWFHSEQTAHLYLIDGDLYQLSMSSLNVGSTTIGWLAFGFQIDERLANEFKSITNLDTDFILKNHNKRQLVAGTHTGKSQSQQLAMSEAIDNHNIPEHYIATHLPIKQFDEQILNVYIYGLRANIVSLLQEQWFNLLSLALLTLLLSLVSAYLIASSISEPLKRLVTQAKAIASGQYHQTIQLYEKNEIGQLAHEFNEMQTAVLEREKAITHFANHDPLTDLPNRNKLNEVASTLINENKHFTLLHLNLRRLKEVNATLGHEVGDEVIKELAKRLQLISSNSAIKLLVHLGGDEFLFVVNGDSVDNTVEEILTQLEPSFLFQGISLELQVRIGVAHFPEHSHDAIKLIQMADTALHHTRKHNRLVQVYHSELDVNSVERLSLINDLKQAIPANELELHYQPKLNLKTGIVTHAEALVRWSHPKLGMIPPDDFIYIAEQTGQIKALTRWVFFTAMQQSKQWKELGIDINIAVNISAENLKEPDFYPYICNTIKQFNIDTNQVTLEVTESSVVEDTESAITLLSRFKEQGLKISIDDYGTGYSSLAQLKQLPVHELKIDKSFVQQLQSDENDQTIVRSTIALAHNMGLHVVAEGIEDQFSLLWLAKHQCELAQGYFISKPKPAKTLTPWLLDTPDFLQKKHSTSQGD